MQGVMGIHKQSCAGQAGNCSGDSWLQDTDLPLLLRERELLKRRVPGRAVQGKDRACMHPRVQ